VTLATSVPILVFLGLSFLDLGLMCVTDRRQTKTLLNAPLIRGRALIKSRMETFWYKLTPVVLVNDR